MIEFRMGEWHETHVRRWFEVGAECVRRDFREYRIDASPDVPIASAPSHHGVTNAVWFRTGVGSAGQENGNLPTEASEGPRNR